MILPVPQSGMSQVQELGVRPSMNQIHDGNQLNPPSNFLNLLNPSPSAQVHNPFPRPPLDQNPSPRPHDDSPTWSHRSRIEQQVQDDKKRADQVEQNQKDNDSTQDSVSKEIKKQPNQARVSGPDPSSGGDQTTIKPDKNQVLGENEEALSNNHEISPDQDTTRVVQTRDSHESIETHQVTNDSSRRSEDQATQGDPTESIHQPGGRDLKVDSDTRVLTKEPLEPNQAALSGQLTGSEVSDGTNQALKANEVGIDLSGVSDSGTLTQTEKSNLGLDQQVVQIIDLRTKQRTLTQNRELIQDTQQPGEKMSKAEMIRNLRNIQDEVTGAVPQIQRNLPTTFGLLSDGKISALVADPSQNALGLDGNPTQITLGSESFIRFFDQKSVRPWSQGIQRLFGRNLTNPLSLIETNSAVQRSKSSESPQMQHQFMLDQLIQEQTRSVMNPTSSDQAQVSEYLKTAGNAEILKSAKFILKDHDKGEITLILKPERLGEIKIQLSLSNNSIEAQILVDNKDVEAAFAENLEELMKAFQEQGFETGDFMITTRENKLASLLLEEQSVLQVQAQDPQWVEKQVYGQDEIHIDLAI